MSVRIKDVLVIKHIERELGRELSEEELAQIHYEGYVEIESDIGLPIQITVPTYSFPYQMLPDYAASIEYIAFSKGISRDGNRWVSNGDVTNE